MKLDYKNKFQPKSSYFSRLLKYWRLHSVALVTTIIAVSLLLTDHEYSQASLSKRDSALPGENAAILGNHAQVESDIRMRTFSLILPRNKYHKSSYQRQKSHTETKQSDEIPWSKFIVKSGYNLGIIAEKAGIGASEIYSLVNTNRTAELLKTLYPGDELRMKITAQGKLMALEYDLHESKKLAAERLHEDENGVSKFQVKTIERPLEVRLAYVSGIIDHSLFMAAQKAGMSEKLTIELSNIFEWDIDFAMEVRQGDRFTAVYEEYYREGEKTKNGNILAAEFINNNTSYRAIRYTDPKGRTDYFTPEGRSLRKTFLRNPIHVARISSRFNSKRKHPILNKIRAHKGVDYAAPKGTAIRATGDGKIVFRGKKGGYGKTIIIQHGQRYSTLYAHLSNYRRSLGVGRKVKQGQTIAYVGQTGLATGPHLHYEFRVYDVHRNPLTFKHPSVKPIKEIFKQDFFNKSQRLLAKLDTIGRLNLALNQ